jgi:hypothetical protein
MEYECNFEFRRRMDIAGHLAMATFHRFGLRNSLRHNPTSANIRSPWASEAAFFVKSHQNGINKAKTAGVRFGPKPILTLPVIEKVKALRADGATVPEIIRRTKFSKASVYRALGGVSQVAKG